MNQDLDINRDFFRPHLWGAGRFDINDDGQAVARLDDLDVPLIEVVRRLRKFGWDLPAVVRFPDLITARAESLDKSFNRAIRESGYEGHYTGLYPLKVNPMAHVVKTFLATTRFGLEAGSKAELFEALALGLPADRPVLINGHKDELMLRAALEALRLGHRVLPILEKRDEFERLHALARKIRVVPRFGVRARLHARGAGRWEESGGDRAKFGLATPHLLELVETLRGHGLLDSWELLHFHIGSQVPGILKLKNAVREATRIYARLVKMGVRLKAIDVGGGLGVDYDGSRSPTDSSVDYSVEEYADTIVWTIKEVCQEEDVPQPELFSESGRYLVADHAVLLVESLGRNRVTDMTPPPARRDEHDLVKDMRTCFKNLRRQNVLQCLHEARAFKEDSLQLFDLGHLGLEERSAVESLYWSILSKSLRHLKGREFELCSREIADQVIVNFSLFQSLPDYWAVNHNFPIMPIDRLDEACRGETSLTDITCDSDGKINSFIAPEGEVRKTLRLHEDNRPGDILGVFLIGAYQDILGDLHNLFGPLNEVEVTRRKRGGFNVGKLDRGSSVSETLTLMHLDPQALDDALMDHLGPLCHNDAERQRLGQLFDKILAGTTYFDPRP